MVNTRNSASKQENEAMTTTGESDVNALLETLPEEYKIVVKVITEIISSQLSDKIVNLHKELSDKDKQINELKSEVISLTRRVDDLELHTDNLDQYERRDTVILSGASLPPETAQENTAHVVTQAIKEHLKINIKEADISVTHRLGKPTQQKNRPIIVKLVNRSLKHDLVGACVLLRPQLFVNESLTPKRRVLLNKVLAIRKVHKPKFQQCYTNDGRIVIKLKNSTQKHTITDEKQLLAFLEMYPNMMETYLQQSTSQS